MSALLVRFRLSKMSPGNASRALESAEINIFFEPLLSGVLVTLVRDLDVASEEAYIA